MREVFIKCFDEGKSAMIVAGILYSLGMYLLFSYHSPYFRKDHYYFLAEIILLYIPLFAFSIQVFYVGSIWDAVSKTKNGFGVVAVSRYVIPLLARILGGILFALLYFLLVEVPQWVMVSGTDAGDFLLGHYLEIFYNSVFFLASVLPMSVIIISIPLILANFIPTIKGRYTNAIIIILVAFGILFAFQILYPLGGLGIASATAIAFVLASLDFCLLRRQYLKCRQHWE